MRCVLFYKLDFDALLLEPNFWQRRNQIVFLNPTILPFRSDFFETQNVDETQEYKGLNKEFNALKKTENKLKAKKDAEDRAVRLSEDRGLRMVFRLRK